MPRAKNIDRCSEILKFIPEYVSVNNCLPSVRLLASKFNISVSMMYKVLQSMVKDGSLAQYQRHYAPPDIVESMRLLDLIELNIPDGQCRDYSCPPW